MKQTIEIDVPEGHEIESVKLCPEAFGDKSGLNRLAIVKIKKKEPEYIEVREYIFKNDNVAMLGILNKSAIHTTGDIEEMEGFVSWRDQDWRKVEI